MPLIRVMFYLLVVVACSSLGERPPSTKQGFHPTMLECQSLALKADDGLVLERQPAAELNDLDWRLSVCVSQYAPLRPKGAALLLSAHGLVSDSVRHRLEKAISTLSPEEQTKVWASFNADQGIGEPR